MKINVFSNDQHFDEFAPQFAVEREVAEVIASFSASVAPIQEHVVTLERPCVQADVERVGVAYGFDPQQDSHAQWLCMSFATREALRAEGFDGFYDRSVLCNTEPMQVVAFTKEQIETL